MRRSGLSSSGLVEEGGGVRRAGRARVLRVRLPRRYVPQLVAHDAHAYGRGGQSHRADGVLLVDEDLPDLLGELVALLGLLAVGGAIHLEGGDHARIFRPLALATVRGVPARDRGAEERLHGIERQGVPWEEIQDLGAVVGPQGDLLLVARDAGE